MLKTMLSFFTGSSGWLYIALLIFGLGVIGTSWLCVGLLEDKAALHVKVEEKEKLIKEKEELIEEKAKEVKRLDRELSQTKADLQTQNALIEQNRIDMVAKEKAFKEAMVKKPKIVTNIKYVPTGNDECSDLNAIIDEYISTGAQQ